MNKKKLLFLAIIIIAGTGLYFFVANNKSNNNGRASFVNATELTGDVVVIEETDQGYVPSEITVKRGAKVAWVNKTSRFIWPASNLHPTHEIYPEFDPGEPYGANQAWVFTFNKIGEWSYHDHLKPNFRGIVKVQ